MGDWSKLRDALRKGSKGGLDELIDGELTDEGFLRLFHKQLQLFLEPSYLEMLRSPRRDRGSRMAVSVLKKTVVLRDIELSAETLNTLFPVLPAPLVFTSVKIASLECSCRSFVTLDRHPVNVALDGVDVTIANPGCAEVGGACASPSRAEEIQRIWAEITGTSLSGGIATPYSKYDAIDGIALDVRRLRVAAVTRSLSGGDVLVEAPWLQCFSVDDTGNRGDLVHCWKSAVREQAQLAPEQDTAKERRGLRHHHHHQKQHERKATASQSRSGAGSSTPGSVVLPERVHLYKKIFVGEPRVRYEARSSRHGHSHLQALLSQVSEMGGV